MRGRSLGPRIVIHHDHRESDVRCVLVGNPGSVVHQPVHEPRWRRPRAVASPRSADRLTVDLGDDMVSHLVGHDGRSDTWIDSTSGKDRPPRSVDVGPLRRRPAPCHGWFERSAVRIGGTWSQTRTSPLRSPMAVSEGYSLPCCGFARRHPGQAATRTPYQAKRPALPTRAGSPALRCTVQVVVTAERKRGCSPRSIVRGRFAGRSPSAGGSPQHIWRPNWVHPNR